MIGVVHYGMGNVASVVNAVRSLEVPASIVRSPSDLTQCKGIILPGVGTFRRGMDHLRELGFVEALNERVIRKLTPLLGICLGMQLLVDKGYEHGQENGLGWIAGSCLPLEASANVRIPHMGWNDLSVIREGKLIHRSDQGKCVYFAHGFQVVLEDKGVVTSQTTHGSPFVASFEKETLFGTQFHPEKSHDQGLEVLGRFIEICLA